MVSTYLYGMNPLLLTSRYVKHRMACLSGLPDDVFVRNFTDQVLKDDTRNGVFQPIEQLRKELLADTSLTGSQDPGAGTRSRRPQRSVATFTRRASVSPRYGRLLHRLAHTCSPPVILELGTAVGLGTLYLATGQPDARVITVEGNPVIAGIAAENFRRAGVGNITLIGGDFDEVLPGLCGQLPEGTLVYIDGNHTGDALQRYFSLLSATNRENLFIFDDINWSESMHRGWKAIRNSGEKGLWIDLFRMGLCLGNYPGPSRFMRFSY
jgi:predicted O-methyltransferase YrrM